MQGEQVHSKYKTNQWISIQVNTEKFTDAASDAALQLTSKKPALFQFRCGSKEKYP